MNHMSQKQPDTLFSLLKTKRFLPLFITQFLGAFNDNAFKNAFLIWFTYDAINTTGISAPMMITIAAGIFILPYLLFSATAGQLADRYKKDELTRVIKIIEIALMTACAIGFFTQSIYALLFILFLMGVQSTFFGPIKFSLLPEHLAQKELLGGNALIEGGTFLSILLGTIFGGLIIRADNGIFLFSIFIISFAILGWLSSRSIPKTMIGDKKAHIGLNVFKETMQVLSIAKSNKIVWTSIIGISWFWLIGATFLTQLPTYTKEILNGNEEVVTCFLTLFSVGIGFGALLAHRLSKGRINGKLIPYGLAGMTGSIILFGIASYTYPPQTEMGIINLITFINIGFISHVIFVSLLMLSVFAGIYIVPLYTLMQHHADDKYMARVIASNNIMNALYMVASSIVIVGLFALNLSVIEVLLSIAFFNLLFFWLLKDLIAGQ